MKFRYFNVILLFSMLLSIFMGKVFADSVTPVPALPQIASGSSLLDRMTPNLIGVTCGLPESLNRVEGTQCCNTTINSDDILQEPLKRAPKYFCIGPVLSKIAGAAGGFLGGLTDWVTGTVSGLAGAVSDLFTLDITGAFGNLKDGLISSTGFPIVKDTIEGAAKSEANLCLSDAFKLMYVSSLSANPAIGMNNPPSAKPQPCIEGAEPTTNDYASASCKCVYSKEDELGVTKLCGMYMTGSKDQQVCKTCANNGGFWTGIGCIKTDLAGFTASVLGAGMGIAGAFALLCIMYAAFILQTSRGNPERIKKAREWINSCLIGLGLIIFSIFILRIIGVDILKIPGLS